MKSVIFDVETTGLPKKGKSLEHQPHIIEIGAIYIDDDGDVTRTLSQLLNPGIPLPDPAMTKKLCGIDESQLADKPLFTEYRPILTQFFTGADNLICHNARFDTDMLRNELLRIGEDVSLMFPWPKDVICTMLDYKHLNGGRWPKLTVLYELIMKKELVQTHRALDDCYAVHEILVKENYFDTIKT